MIVLFNLEELVKNVRQSLLKNVVLRTDDQCLISSLMIFLMHKSKVRNSFNHLNG